MTDKQKANREKLIQLMTKNPDLPIVSLVDSDIVADDGGYWLASIGFSRVDEYILPRYEGPVILKSDDDVFDTLEKCLPPDEFDLLPEDEEDCVQYYNDLPWKKAIILYIELPDE